jgi:hypothetical protein
MNIKQCTKEILNYELDKLHNQEVTVLTPSIVFLQYINQG